VPGQCPECGNSYVFYNHKFKPPKKDDLKAWKVVSFLYEHGFTYQHIHKDFSNLRIENYADYPKNLDEAKEFVIKYKSQAKNSLPSSVSPPTTTR